jgi:hypothetical protein
MAQSMVPGLFGQIWFWIVLGLALHLFLAFGLYAIAEKRAVYCPWLAFIPVAQFYLTGKLADEYDSYVNDRRGSAKYGLPVLFVGAVLTGFISYVGLMVLIALACVWLVFYYISLYKILDWCSSAAGILTVLSVVLFIAAPFFIFAVRNRVNPAYASYGVLEKLEADKKRRKHEKVQTGS